MYSKNICILQYLFEKINAEGKRNAEVEVDIGKGDVFLSCKILSLHHENLGTFLR